MARLGPAVWPAVLERLFEGDPDAPLGGGLGYGMLLLLRHSPARLDQRLTNLSLRFAQAEESPRLRSLWSALRLDRAQASTADAHKFLGYTLVGLSLAQTGLGYYNFWNMRDRKTGTTKRWVHLTLSTLATAGFVAAAVIARNSREEIDSGQIDGKTFGDLYDTHRMVGIISTASVFLTAIVVVW